MREERRMEMRIGGATTRIRVDMDTVKCEMERRSGGTSVIKINCQLILYERTNASEPKKKRGNRNNNDNL